MINIRANQVATITGIRGSGKSYLLDKLINVTPSYVVYDVMHEHENKNAVIVNNLKDLHHSFYKQHKRIIYHPQHIDVVEFDWLCLALYSTGNRMFFVEEANRVMPNGQITKGASQLIDLGRHRNVGMIVVTRRIALLDKLPVSQSEHILIFKTVLPNDIQYLKEFIGPDADKASALDGYKFLYHTKSQTVTHPAV